MMLYPLGEYHPVPIHSLILLCRPVDREKYTQKPLHEYIYFSQCRAKRGLFEVYVKNGPLKTFRANDGDTFGTPGEIKFLKARCFVENKPGQLAVDQPGPGVKEFFKDDDPVTME